MTARNFALSFGIVFLLAGLSGFVPRLSPDHVHSGLNVTAGSRLARGLFPVNVLYNLIHIAFGIWGVLASRGPRAARGYGRSVAVIYGLLTIMGLVPLTSTTFGLVPIYGNDIWLHAVLALVATYFGFVHRDGNGEAVA